MAQQFPGQQQMVMQQPGTAAGGSMYGSTAVAGMGQAQAMGMQQPQQQQAVQLHMPQMQQQPQAVMQPQQAMGQQQRVSMQQQMQPQQQQVGVMPVYVLVWKGVSFAVSPPRPAEAAGLFPCSPTAVAVLARAHGSSEQHGHACSRASLHCCVTSMLRLA